jgi:hypothetical protein
MPFFFIYFGGFEMKTLISILFALFCFASANAQITWTKIETNWKNNLKNVLFPHDVDSGYFAGEKLVLRSFNGGASFDSLDILNNNNIYFLSADIFAPIDFNDAIITGVVVNNGNNEGDISTQPRYCITSNGGNNWKPIMPSPHYSFSRSRASFPINLSVGYWIMREYNSWTQGYMIKTINGGTSWSSVFPPAISAYSGIILFRNNNSGFVSGSQGEIIKTTDGGISWNQINFFGNPKKALKGICYLDKNSNNYWIFVGIQGIILKTIDAGENWKIINSNIESTLNDIKFSENGKIGIAVGDEGKILTTIDSGETWKVYSHPSAETLNAISIPPGQDTIAYIVGSNGIILKTKNLNIVGVEDNTNISKIDFNISPNPATDNISISFSSGLQNQYISIFNSLGIEMNRFENNELNGKNSINFYTEDYSSGVYYCSLNSGMNRITKSFVVVR